MFVVVYRWRLRPGFEDTHRAGWRAVTESIRRAYATGGSRLHRDAEGAWIAYAVWPDEATYERFRAAPSVAEDEDRARMTEGLDGPVEILHRLTVLDDLLAPLTP